MILSIAMLCAGCSAIKLGYDHADWYLRYKINDYTSFNARQKEDIRKEVAAYMLWHRKNALPEYAAFLQNVYVAVQQDGRLKAEDVARLRSEYSRLYKKTVAPAIRPAAHLLSTIDNRQIEELCKTFADKNRKQKEETLYGSEQKNIVMRAERNIDMVEKLTGRLSRDQKEKIRALSLHIPFANKYFIENRETSQAGLIALLNNKAGEEKIAAFLMSWINSPEAARTPQQQLAIQSYENAMDEMTARIFELLTARQKEHLRKEIMSYIKDIQKLIAEQKPASAASRQALQDVQLSSHDSGAEPFRDARQSFAATTCARA